MKKILFGLLLLTGVFCIGCKNNNDNNFDEVVVEEVTVEKNEANEQNNDNTDNKDNDTENNGDMNVFFQKGKQMLDNDGNIDGAIEQFNKALEIDSKADWVYGDLGRAKAAKEDFNGAIECYTKAIKLNNERSIYYDWRATAYRALGKEDLAEKDQKISDELHANGMD